MRAKKFNRKEHNIKAGRKGGLSLSKKRGSLYFSNLAKLMWAKKKQAAI